MTDAELMEFVTEFRAGILAGQRSRWMCAAVCMPLVTLLNMHGVNATIVESSLPDCNHVWLLLPDGRALDPTADQFNRGRRKFPPVYLGAPTAIHINPGPFGAPRFEVRFGPGAVRIDG